MDFELTKSQKEIQKAAKEFAKGEFDKELALELDRNRHRYCAGVHPDLRSFRNASLSWRRQRRTLWQYPRTSVRCHRHLGLRLGHGCRVIHHLSDIYSDHLAHHQPPTKRLYRRRVLI